MTDSKKQKGYSMARNKIPKNADVVVLNYDYETDDFVSLDNGGETAKKVKKAGSYIFGIAVLVVVLALVATFVVGLVSYKVVPGDIQNKIYDIGGYSILDKNYYITSDEVHPGDRVIYFDNDQMSKNNLICLDYNSGTVQNVQGNVTYILPDSTDGKSSKDLVRVNTLYLRYKYTPIENKYVDDGTDLGEVTNNYSDSSSNTNNTNPEDREFSTSDSNQGNHVEEIAGRAVSSVVDALS